VSDTDIERALSHIARADDLARASDSNRQLVDTLLGMAAILIGYKKVRAVWAPALAVRMAECALGDKPKRANDLYLELRGMVGLEKAEWLAIKTFVKYAKSPEARRHHHPNPRQRIYKVLCRHVSPLKATRAFLRSDPSIQVPCKILWGIRMRQSIETSRRSMAATGC